MRILIVSMDTRGGVEPYGALARGLAQSGHSVTVAAPIDLAYSALPVGINVIPLPGSSREAVELLGSTENVMTAPRRLRQRLRDTVGGAVTAVLDTGQSFDLVLAGVGGSAVGEAVAAAQDARFLSAHLQPLGPPNSLFPGVLAPPSLRRPGLPRWIGHRISSQFVALPAAGTRGTALAAAGLGPRARPRRLPGAIYGYSQHVVPRPTSWAPEHVVTGYWRSPVQAEALAPELSRFLDSGDAPIVAGFGSMKTRDPDAVARALVDASAALGMRLVILTGWNGRFSAGDLPESVFVTEHAPHETLYARASIALHHGGAGTTAASLIAGLPTVTVPFAADQPFWGERVRELGAGPAPIAIRDVTVESIAPALAFAARETTREVTRRLGEELRQEDGVARAVEAINSLVESGRANRPPS